MNATQVEIVHDLFGRIGERTAQVGIVGLGYVGLPLALLFSRNGYQATGFDVDTAKVEKLQRGETYIQHIPAGMIDRAIRSKRLQATADFSGLSEMDVVIICVPTPLGEHREPDLRYIEDTAEEISKRLRPGQLIVLESTTYPGTTEDVVLPILLRSGLRCPATKYAVDNLVLSASEAESCEFLLAFSPEREDPGNRDFQTHQVPKVIGGVNAASALAARNLYQTVFQRTVLVSSARTAEMTKILENTYRAVNIALVNELKLLCLRMDVDIWEVIEAAKSKPFGFAAFYPGPGLGGHCIPIDPFYLTWKAHEYDFPTRFIELAGEINAAMPAHVVQATADALSRQHKCLDGARILVLGIAYKKDVDDLRESPSLRIIELLRARGAEVSYHDPYVQTVPQTRKHDIRLQSVPLTSEELGQYDAALICTDHSCLNYEQVVCHSQLVVDTRNATHDVKYGREKIVHC
jgi:UDP-N-acetyl-D-glucosamine dehydrogenase